MTFCCVLNQSMFDWPWSVIHFASDLIIGAIFSLLLGRWRSSSRVWLSGFLLLVLWELFEMWLRYIDVHATEVANALRTFIPHSWFSIESWANSTGDLIIGGVGLFIGQAIFHRPKQEKTAPHLAPPA